MFGIRKEVSTDREKSRQEVNVKVDAVRLDVYNHTVPDPQVLERLDRIIEMLGASEEERRELVEATASLKEQTDKLQGSLKTP